MKHTPEPWNIGWGSGGLTGPTCARPSGPFCGGKDWPYIPIYKGVETIALVPAPDRNLSHIPDRGEMEANAHLIAAAPELLEACKGSLYHFETCECGNTIELKRLLKRAIVKAEKGK